MRKGTISGKEAGSQPASDLFVANGASGGAAGFAGLVNLMGDHGCDLFKSSEKGKNRSSSGLIGRDNVVIVKINSQWDERGGTNTDLLKSLIGSIVNHPNGFIGEIVVADNGQSQYGSTGQGGRLDYSRNNSEDTAQSVQKVVDAFSGHKVSGYSWDKITKTRVSEYEEGDITDGYVIAGKVNTESGNLLSYPKFKTGFGTLVSFRRGVWDAGAEKYLSDRLKVINVPVLKSHFIYGVTGCVKHYMGVGSDKLTAQLGARSHVTVKSGGMGSEMVGTRFPVLNVLDAIWVNPKPCGGPGTRYEAAVRTDVIAASVDPVALDYWAAKNILSRAAVEKGYSDLTTIDPDNKTPGFFGHWLRLSMDQINKAGYRTTVDEAQMNVYVAEVHTD